MEIRTVLCLLVALLIGYGTTNAGMSNRDVLKKIDAQTQEINTKFDEGQTERSDMTTNLNTILGRLTNIEGKIDGISAVTTSNGNKSDSIMSALSDVEQELFDINAAMVDFDVSLSTEVTYQIANIYGRLIVTQHEVEDMMKSFFTVNYGTQAAADMAADGYKSLWEIFNMEGGTTTIHLP